MSGEASFEVIGKFVCEQNFKVSIIGVASAELGRRCSIPMQYLQT